MPIRDSEIGKNTKIWEPTLVNIYKCRIGDGCNIAAFTEIGSDVVIGNDCKIQAFVFIPSGVYIGNNVFIGPHVCFTNDKYPNSRECGKFMKTIIDDDVSIGANATIICGVTIGRGAFVAAGALVTKDVLPGESVIGVPAKTRRLKQQ